MEYYSAIKKNEITLFAATWMPLKITLHEVRKTKTNTIWYHLYRESKIWYKWTYGGTVVKNPPATAGDARDAGSIPGSEKPPGEGNGNPLQYSCLRNPMDRGAWWATFHGVTKSQTRLSTHAHTWNRIMDTERRLVVANGEGCERGWGLGIGISRCKLQDREWINNKGLLYSTGNYITILW